MKIAVDFDGTIVEHKYPAIGNEYLFAIETLKELQRQQHQIILWTFRVGKELDEAIEYCRNRGLKFYAVNKNYPEEVYNETISRKIISDIYIDDRNLGGFPGWQVVFEMIMSGKPFDPHYCDTKKLLKRSILTKIKELFTNKAKST
jgi:hydroxymethylpyrimidine pyrophosphatase-like HAD family hydrolase